MNARTTAKLKKGEKQALFKLLGGTGSVAMLAAVIEVLMDMGFKKWWIKRFFDNLRAFYQRRIWGEKLDSNDVIDHAIERCGFDFTVIRDDIEYEVI